MIKTHFYLVFIISLFLACNKPSADDTSATDSTKTEKEAPLPKADAQQQSTQNADDALLGGVWYSPDAKTALLIQAEDGKITSIEYAAREQKFKKGTIENQSVDMGILTVQFSVATQKITLESGYTPMGAYYILSTAQNPSQQQTVYQVSEEMWEYPNAKSVFLTFFSKSEFMSYDNKYQLLQTPQEGAGEDEVFFILKNSRGEEEYITAKVNAQQHQLQFNSTSLGEVKAEFEDFSLLFYAPNGQMITTMSKVVEEK